MRKIIINKLTINNFKGIKSFEVILNDVLTTIQADNGVGKSTIVDAFLWLFFGKNSAWQSNFEVRPQDSDGKIIHNLESSVEAVFNEFSCKRVLSEKWTTSRGSLEPELKGTETTYYWNDVPLREKDFKQKISEIVSEDLFMLITNPYYFNGLKPDVRREMLIKLAGGDIPDSLVAGGNTDFIELLGKLTGKDLKEYMLQIQASKKKLKEELDSIPVRIDEVTKSIPSDIPDKSKCLEEIGNKQQELLSIDELIADQSKQNESHLKVITAKQQEVFVLRNTILSEEHSIKTKASESGNEKQKRINAVQMLISTAETGLFTKERDIKTKSETLTQVSKEKSELLERYHKRESEVFDEAPYRLRIADIELQSPDLSGVLDSCPTCKREFDLTQKEQSKEAIKIAFNTEQVRRITAINSEMTEAKQQFNSKKAKDLAEWLDKGKKMKVDCDALDEYIKKAEAEVQVLKEEIKKHLENIEAIKSESTESIDVQKLISESPVIIQAKEKIISIEQEISSMQSSDKPKVSDEYKQKKAEIQEIINQQNRLITISSQAEASKQRIDDLKARFRQLGNEMSLLEKEEFTAYQFNKAKMNALEGIINSKFSYVRFKMFRTLMNGNEEPICECQVNSNGSWVDYSTNANYAAKINAGIDIINAFSSNAQISFPIFIDNAESVSVIQPTLAQVIRLEKVYGINNLTIV